MPSTHALAGAANTRRSVRVLFVMPRRSLPFRLLAVLFAAIQVLLPTVASIADTGHGPARAVAQAETGGTVRIEQHQEQSCVPLATDACAFCEILSQRGAPAEVRVPAPALVGQVAAVAAPDERPAARERVSATAQPRAPPLA